MTKYIKSVNGDVYRADAFTQFSATKKGKYEGEDENGDAVSFPATDIEDRVSPTTIIPCAGYAAIRSVAGIVERHAIMAWKIKGGRLLPITFPFGQLRGVSAVEHVQTGKIFGVCGETWPSLEEYKADQTVKDNRK